MAISLDVDLPGIRRDCAPSARPPRPTGSYREPGLSREAAAIWADIPPPREPIPSLPSGPRCKRCQYRDDAPGHAYLCGTMAAHP
jgi:hypothetical protein